METMTAEEIKALFIKWGNRKGQVARVVAPMLGSAFKSQRAIESGVYSAGNLKTAQATVTNALTCAAAAETFAEPEPQNGVSPTVLWNGKTSTFEVRYW